MAYTVPDSVADQLAMNRWPSTDFLNCDEELCSSKALESIYLLVRGSAETVPEIINLSLPCLTLPTDYTMPFLTYGHSPELMETFVFSSSVELSCGKKVHYADEVQVRNSKVMFSQYIKAQLDWQAIKWRKWAFFLTILECAPPRITAGFQ